MGSKRQRITIILLLCAIIIDVNAVPTSNKQKVCVIGAGAAGLVSTKNLADNSDKFDIVVFEKSSDAGGVWIYTNKTDLDEHNLPVHSSMYKNVRTNTAKEIMAFPDYQNFGGENKSSVTHYTVLSYLRNYTEHFKLRQYIQFNTLVKKVTPIVDNGSWQTTKYEIETLNFETNQTSKTTCNAVMICNGHYFEPHMPNISGIESFPGKVMHSHTYRIPEEFAGQIVAVLGAGPSGVDISIDLSESVRKVYLSHNHDKIIAPLPSNIEQVAGIVSAKGDALILKDGTNITADTVIYCTGYDYIFPFLDEKSGIVVDDNRVEHVYKHVINVKHPSIGFIGLISSSALFPGVHMQANYFVSMLKGNFVLPNEQAMLKDIEKMLEGIPKRQSHVIDSVQWAYYDEMAKSGRFAPLPEFYQKGAELWMENFRNDPWHFGEKNLVILENGDVQLVDPNKAARN